MPRRCLGSLAAILGLIALPAGAQAQGPETFYVLDGPFAGTPLKTKLGDPGFVSKQENPLDARGFIRPPNDRCPYDHFEGRIGGKKIKEEDCLRLGRYGYAQPFLKEMGAAIKKEAEEKATKKRVDGSIENLGDAFEDLRKARKAGKLTGGNFDKVQDLLEDAVKLDKDAKNELKDGDKKKAENDLEKALRKKHQAVDGVPIAVNLLQPPQLAPLDAVFNPGLAETVYTANVIANPDGRELTYTWSFAELNDPTCILFQPNTPQNNQATWHHHDSEGCNHGLEGSNGHQGVIGAVVDDGKFACSTGYFGSNTGTGTQPSCRETG